MIIDAISVVAIDIITDATIVARRIVVTCDVTILATIGTIIVVTNVIATIDTTIFAAIDATTDVTSIRALRSLWVSCCDT